MLNMWLLLHSLVFCAACTVQKQALELPKSKSLRAVPVAKPALRPFSDTVEFVGFVEPKRLVSVHFLLPGRVARCLSHEGQVLREGEEICRLDESAVNLEVARSQNALQAASRVLATNLPEKQKALFEAGVIGQSEFEQVRVQSETAKAQYSDVQSLFGMAVKKQKEHVLRAPWAGIITKLFAKPGQPISPDLPAAIFSDEHGFQVKADLHASYFTSLKLGATGKIKAISSKKLPANIALRVAQKATAITPSTQSFSVSMGLFNSKDSEKLTSGILVSGEIEVEKILEAMLIPEASLNTWSQDGSASVYVRSPEGRLKLTNIRTGALGGGWIQVKEGLSTSDDVVTSIAPDLMEGMRVQ